MTEYVAEKHALDGVWDAAEAALVSHLRASIKEAIDIHFSPPPMSPVERIVSNSTMTEALAFGILFDAMSLGKTRWGRDTALKTVGDFNAEKNKPWMVKETAKGFIDVLDAGQLITFYNDCFKLGVEAAVMRYKQAAAEVEVKIIEPGSDRDSREYIDGLLEAKPIEENSKKSGEGGGNVPRLG